MIVRGRERVRVCTWHEVMIADFIVYKRVVDMLPLLNYHSFLLLPSTSVLKMCCKKRNIKAGRVACNAVREIFC